jgi:hypothetical protein
MVWHRVTAVTTGSALSWADIVAAAGDASLQVA